MYEHNALGYRSGLALCLTKVRSSRARCPATALICICKHQVFSQCNTTIDLSLVIRTVLVITNQGRFAADYHL